MEKREDGMTSAYFDASAFYVAIEQIRQERNISWYQLFRQTGINHANLYRMQQDNYKPRADTLAILIVWSGLDANVFMKQGEQSA